jgi:diguanylate cyclase (GGDEF)-like protein
MARAAAVLFFCGGTIGAVSVALPHSQAANDAGLISNIVVAYVGGAALLALGPRLPHWTFHAALGAGTLVVTRAIYLSHEPSSFYAAWYVWIALYVFHFFTRAQAGAHVVLIGISYAAVLAHDPGHSAVAQWLTTVMTLIVASVFIDALVRRVRRHALDAAATARNLAVVADATRKVSTIARPHAARRAICEAAVEVSRGTAAALWEPTPDSAGLAVTAGAGIEASDTPLFFTGPPSGATRTFTSGQPLFVPDLRAEGDTSEDRRRPSAVSCLWQPVTRQGVSVGVLSVYWDARVDSLSDNLTAVVELLAAEAGAAMDRADLLSRLEGVARTDTLTGLPNRRAWEEELSRELARAHRGDRPLCVAMIDLDRFKNYNDEHGHQAGDRLLKQTAAAWSRRLRLTDVLARYGGEEFAIALPDCSLSSALELLERLRQETPGDQTCSIGVARWDREEDADRLLGRADEALYQAKRTGRNRVVSAPEDHRVRRLSSP